MLQQQAHVAVPACHVVLERAYARRIQIAFQTCCAQQTRAPGVLLTHLGEINMVANAALFEVTARVSHKKCQYGE